MMDLSILKEDKGHAGKNLNFQYQSYNKQSIKSSKKYSSPSTISTT